MKGGGGKSGRTRKQVEAILEKEGVAFKLIRSPGHNIYEIILPTGDQCHITTPNSCSCSRGMKNFRADIRRRIRGSSHED